MKALLLATLLLLPLANAHAREFGSGETFHCKVAGREGDYGDLEFRIQGTLKAATLQFKYNDEVYGSAGYEGQGKFNPYSYQHPKFGAFRFHVDTPAIGKKNPCSTDEGTFAINHLDFLAGKPFRVQFSVRTFACLGLNYFGPFRYWDCQ